MSNQWGRQPMGKDSRTLVLGMAGRNGSEVIEDAQVGRILADAERQRGSAI
ncbi:MAG: hypothetical protein P4L59_16185 [Desulfosporosinus sp.]|nr:hypothetical protein [Desulfosporosinus sp.]